MKVKVKVGSEVILDSSKQKVAKVIEPEPAYEGTMKVKKPVQPVVADINVQKPRDAIFHRNELASDTSDVLMSKEDKMKLDKLKVSGDGPVSVLVNPEEEKTIENVAVEPMKEEIKEHVVQEQFKLDEVDKTMDETGSDEQHSGNEELPKAVEEITEESVQTETNTALEEESVKEMSLDEELDQMQQELDDMEEEYDYDQYMSNRDRSNIRKANKQSKKSNTDYKGEGF